MGTTLTAAYSVGVDLFVIHLGDSRAYLYRKGELQRLTKDHTYAQAMADAGYIAPEEVRRHARRNTLTNYLGGRHGKFKADLRWLRLADGDRLLLCTDGLSDMVDDGSIARILREHDRPQDAAQALLDEALERGGKDNVTVVVARYEIPGGLDQGGMSLPGLACGSAWRGSSHREAYPPASPLHRPAPRQPRAGAVIRQSGAPPDARRRPRTPRSGTPCCRASAWSIPE